MDNAEIQVTRTVFWRKKNPKSCIYIRLGCIFPAVSVNINTTSSWYACIIVPSGKTLRMYIFLLRSRISSTVCVRTDESAKLLSKCLDQYRAISINEAFTCEDKTHSGFLVYTPSRVFFCFVFFCVGRGASVR